MCDDSYNKLKDNYNYGIAFLRVFMAFEVILAHYWDVHDPNKLSSGLVFFNSFKLVAVPTFMIIAFFFMEPKLIVLKKGFIKNRMSRLLVPYVGWAVIYFIIIFTTQKIGNFVFINKVNIKSLGWQLLLGACGELCPQLWYQTVLIIITILFIVLFLFLNKDMVFAVIFLGSIFSLFLQYSGINYSMFGLLDSEQRYTLGRVLEMIPFAFIGLVLAKIDFKKYRCNQNWAYIIGYASLIFFINKFAVFSQINTSFAYAGIQLIAISTLTVLIGITFPTEKIPYKLKNTIKFLSRYTFGIFCIHWGVGLYFMKFLQKMGIQTRHFSECIIIWIVCYFLTFFISKLPFKICKMLVE